jgi:hypothetical protein
MQFSNMSRNKGILLGATLIALAVSPFLVFGGREVIHVDSKASGMEDGSRSHPYDTISEGLDHADDGDEVEVEKGTYEENITLPKGVWLYGAGGDRDDVVIKANHDDKPTVEMKHDSKLSDVTVRGGRHGVRILEDSKARLYDVRVTKSNRDGIHIDSAEVSKKRRIVLDKVEVEKSDRSGVYSEKRSITIIDSTIHDNGGDGVDLASGTHAWLEKSDFNSNRGSGAKLVLDGASIWSKNNNFKKNGREGIEVSSFGGQGTIEFKKAEVSGNGRYGVARLGKTAKGMQMFGNLSFGIGINGSIISGNALGNLSPVLWVK